MGGAFNEKFQFWRMRSSCALSLNILFDESSGCESLHGVKRFFTNIAIYIKKSNVLIKMGEKMIQN